MATNISPKGRVSFESVWRPSSMEGNATKKYSVTLLIPKKPTDPTQRALLKKMHDACQELCRKEFGCELGGKVRGKIVKSPFRCGSEKEHLSGHDASIYFIRFSGKMKPQVVDAAKRPIEEDSGVFYNGCWAHVSYSVFKYDKSGNVGIGLGLNNIQKVADGDPFGGSSSNAEDDFEELEELGALAGGDDSDDLAF